MTLLFTPPDDTHLKSLAGVTLASFTRRTAAFAIDFTIAALLFMGISVWGLLLLQKLGWVVLHNDVKLEFTFFTNWYSVAWLVVYFTLSTYFMQGQTIGKRICGIRIVSLIHDHLSFWHSLERALGYGASALEAGFGFFQFFLRADRRTVHDRIAEPLLCVIRCTGGSPSNHTQSRGVVREPAGCEQAPRNGVLRSDVQSVSTGGGHCTVCGRNVHTT